ncbi:MAG: Nif3-like dinuclear metal center hexameric protein [Clostridia bacterium]|nr:Nif3-like dinuclear metal center hexameric protein [Clostridia bacterium]
MIKLCEITKKLEERFPPFYAESFDNIGLLAGKSDKAVTKVLLCLDCTPMAVEEAIKSGCEFIITHHPLIFSPLKELSDKTQKGEMIVNALENNISIYSAHTNLDSAPGGLTDFVAEKLGLTPEGNLQGNLGRICAAPPCMTAKELCALIKKEFSIKHLYSTFKEDRPLRKIAVCNGGGGGELLDSVNSLGADVYISGDLKHHEILEFQNSHKCDYIEIRHFDCEIVVTELLKKVLGDLFGSELECIIFKSDSPLIDTDELL